MLVTGFNGSDFSYPQRYLLGFAVQRTCEVSADAYIFSPNVAQVLTPLFRLFNRDCKYYYTLTISEALASGLLNHYPFYSPELLLPTSNPPTFSTLPWLALCADMCYSLSKRGKPKAAYPGLCCNFNYLKPSHVRDVAAIFFCPVKSDRSDRQGQQ